MTTVTHIVPLFAPVIDGVGDYALKLAKALRTGHSIDARFVVADPSWLGPNQIEGFDIAGATSFDTSRMFDAIRDDEFVILHYVGYGYHPKGIPRWLVEAIEQWRTAKPHSRLITIFHEIWSNGLPWKSVFYLAPLQRRLVAALLHASDCGLANTRRSRQKLFSLKREVLTLFAPVSANIEPKGEPASHPRGSELYQPLIFGQPWTRRNCVRRFEPLLCALQTQGRLARVIVMGKQASFKPPSADVARLRAILPDEKILVAGEKPDAEAAVYLDQCDFVLVPGNPTDLCKSSIAMSAFACGCPVVVKPDYPGESLSPLDWTHIVSIPLSECNLDHIAAFELQKWNLQRVAIRAREWYLRNAGWQRLADIVANVILRRKEGP